MNSKSQGFDKNSELFGADCVSNLFLGKTVGASSLAGQKKRFKLIRSYVKVWASALEVVVKTSMYELDKR